MKRLLHYTRVRMKLDECKNRFISASWNLFPAGERCKSGDKSAHTILDQNLNDLATVMRRDAGEKKFNSLLELGSYEVGECLRWYRKSNDISASIEKKLQVLNTLLYDMAEEERSQRPITNKHRASHIILAGLRHDADIEHIGNMNGLLRAFDKSRELIRLLKRIDNAAAVSLINKLEDSIEWKNAVSTRSPTKDPLL
jgi:hypothetical protein